MKYPVLDQTVGGVGPDTEYALDGNESVPAPLSVIVNYQTWLPLTENWIHTQLACLPDSVRAHVVCMRTADLEALNDSAFRYRPSAGTSDLEACNLTAYKGLSLLNRWRLFVGTAARLRGCLGRKSSLLASVAQARGASVVHSHFGYTAWRASAAIQRLGLGHIVSCYGVDISALPVTDPVWYRRYEELFGRVDQVLCEGPAMGERVRELGCPEHKVRVHHLGVRLEQLPFRPRRWEPGEPLRVLIAASFREKKGIPNALAALGRVRLRCPLTVTVVGDAGANPKANVEKSRIQAAMARSGLGDCVTFTGYLPHAELIAQAYDHHLFLSPSMTAADGDTEGGAPVALMEMAAAGLVIVSTRHADIPEVIRNGRDGLLAEENDAEDIAQKLIWLIENPAAWQAMRASARRRIEEEFDAYRQGRRLEALYRAVAGRGAAH